MRIGIYGGSFNPPHIGHVQAAAQIIEKFRLDKLLVIPAYMPPHKQLPSGSPDAETRLAMTKLAFASVPQAEVSDIEIKREKTSYTADTVLQLKDIYPECDLFLVMGTDMFLSFSTWYHPEIITENASLIVMDRYETNTDGSNAETKLRLEKEFGARVYFAENRITEISSTEVRRMLRFRCADSILPAGVEDFILENRLYGISDRLKNLPFDRLEIESLSLHDDKRKAHAKGCCETAVELALLWGADPVSAARAGILHDITKALSPNAHLLLCDKYGDTLRESEKQNAKLLHAKTGALVAKYIFGESDEVCDAIRFHTTGKPEMTLLEKIIYLADYIEPTRTFTGVEPIRRLAYSNLDDAMFAGLDLSLQSLKRRNCIIDSNSYEAWTFYAPKGEF